MLPALPGVQAALGRLLGGKRSLLVQNQWFLAPPAAATCQNQHTPVNIAILMNRHFQMGNQINLKQQQKDHSAGNPPTCPSPRDARCQPTLCHTDRRGCHREVNLCGPTPRPMAVKVPGNGPAPSPVQTCLLSKKAEKKNAGIRHPEPLLLFSAPSERQRSIICVNLKIKINSGFLQPKPREHFVYVHFLHTCRHEVDR